MPKVSVIVPVYNVEKYLEKCLNSIINQTYKDLEIICVDDGSIDNSPEILKKYAKSDNRIKIINKKNGGLSSARNAGLDIATGEFCYFVDSDDWIELDTIELCMQKMAENDVDAVVHGIKNIVEESPEGTAISRQKWLDSFIKPDGIYDVPIEINKKIPPVAWNKLYKIEIINKYHCRFPEGLINEDEYFVWAYMIHCKNYYYLNKELYNYISRINSIMGTRDNSPKVLDILEIQKIIYKIVEKYKNIEDYHEFLTNKYLFEIDYLYRRMPGKYNKGALKKIKEYYDKINHDKRILKAYKNRKYARLKQFIQNIFSIKKSDDGTRKIITILGIKIKFRK